MLPLNLDFEQTRIQWDLLEVGGEVHTNLLARSSTAIVSSSAARSFRFLSAFPAALLLGRDAFHRVAYLNVEGIMVIEFSLQVRRVELVLALH